MNNADYLALKEKMHETTYIIIDLHEHKSVSRAYPFKLRNRARSQAEKLNLKYGGHRYTAKAIFKRD